MYQRILVPLENSAYDAGILKHVCRLARLCNSSIVLIHVADGWAARNLNSLTLRESEEMQADRAYLDGLCEKLHAEGFVADSILAGGVPAVGDGHGGNHPLFGRLEYFNAEGLLVRRVFPEGNELRLTYASGASRCIRNANSNDAIRASSWLSMTRSCLCSSFSRSSASSFPR